MHRSENLDSGQPHRIWYVPLSSAWKRPVKNAGRNLRFAAGNNSERTKAMELFAMRLKELRKILNAPNVESVIKLPCIMPLDYLEQASCFGQHIL